MDLQLKGRKAILAGATKGLGRFAAEALAREGVDIAISARGQDGIDETVKVLEGLGVRAFGQSVDLTDPEAYRAWVNSAAEQLGGCDIFIGFASAGGLQATEEGWQNAFTVDVLGTWRGIDAAMPYLEKSDAASIVVIGTSVAIQPDFGPQAYAAMKAAIVHHAGALAQRLAPKGIRVNSVSPGPVYIDDGDWEKIKTNRPEVYEATLAKVPMGRLGRPEEVANVIAFLCSPTIEFVTGTNVVVDGGLTKRIQF